jgi:hypothetical protein
MSSRDQSMSQALKEMRKIVSDLSPEILAKISNLFEGEDIEPVSETISRFLDSYSDRLLKELSFLGRFSTPTPRVVAYEPRETPNEIDDASWDVMSVAYAAPPFFPRGVSDLRNAMDAASQKADGTEAVTLWLGAAEGPDDSNAFILLFRDQDGSEALFGALGGRMRRLPFSAEAITRFLGDMLHPYLQRSGSANLAAELTGADSKKALDKALKEKGMQKLTQERWEVIAEWVAASDAVHFDRLTFAGAHASAWSFEAHTLLRLSTHTLTGFFEKIKADYRRAVEQAEKNHDKKLARLRSDLEKMRMLADGVKKRADRADADNRKLLRRIQEAEKAAGAANVVSAASTVADAPGTTADSAGGVTGVRRALDAFFA